MFLRRSQTTSTVPPADPKAPAASASASASAAAAAAAATPTQESKSDAKATSKTAAAAAATHATTSASAGAAAPNAAAAKDGRGTPQLTKAVTTRETAASPPPAITFVREAVRALNSGISDAVVDVRVSINEHQEADLARNGYIQVLQELAATKRGSAAALSTFGNKCSLWIWRRNQGTCSGRLKPIVDIILHSDAISSDLVLSGYTAEPHLISGQTLWLKRAATEEEEKDAIIDLYVTTGRMKDTSDPIWSTPGVGWIRVDGNFSKSRFGAMDAFLWYRPARTRSADVSMLHPMKGAVALSDETRLTKIISAVRVALRHYIPVNDIKRLATLTMEGNQLNLSTVGTNAIRSERMVDFSAHYHSYGSKGKMQLTNWGKLLAEVGIRMKPADVTLCFNFFDTNHNGFISIEEYTKVLALTDYELDLALERIRLKLLYPCLRKDALKSQQSMSAVALSASKAHIGVIGAQSISPHPDIGKNKIKENVALSSIFQMMNSNGDGILSLDEVMDLASKLEVFLTEEEARKVFAMLDVNNDDRIEESDFIAFMRRDSVSVIKKAFRLREAAAFFRNWLVRGSGEKPDASSSTTASNKQWEQFKARYERSSGQKFPGYLSAHVLQLTLANLGFRLATVEARELTLIVAPEKNGRIHLSELHSFMGRTCRSFGELVALFNREILKDLMEPYRAHMKAIKTTGKEDPDLSLIFRRKVDEIRKSVESVYVRIAEKEKEKAEGEKREEKEDRRDDDEDEGHARALSQTAPVAQPAEQHRVFNTSHEVISIAQLRAGLHDLFQVDKLPLNLQPNIEEWACLAILVGADIAEGDIFGVRLKYFIEGIAKYIYTTMDEANPQIPEKTMVEIVCRELKMLIYYEAKNASRDKRPNYKAAFDLFDVDKSGTITVAEFKARLQKLQLLGGLSDNQIASIMALFDRDRRGTISFEEFRAFAETAVKDIVDDDDEDLPPGLAGHRSGSRGGDGRHAYYDEEDTDDDDDDEDKFGVALNNPPATLTPDAECDRFAWYLYRQAYNASPIDPLGVITNLESMCSETEIAQKKELISVKEFWNLLFELGLRGNMTREQFIHGIRFVLLSGHGGDEDRVDYSMLCRYAMRMGDAYNARIQEKNRELEKQFGPLLADLKKYFKTLCDDKQSDPNDPPRYEKIFRRLDGDGDGMLTPKEFRTGLKRLQYKDIKHWSVRMVRRLFNECDKNRDGLLSIKEFTLYILERTTDARPPKAGGEQKHQVDERKGLDSEDKLNLSDDEEDALFNRHRPPSDHQLLKKVNDILYDIVPNESGDPKKHLEMVRNSVRRFFQRADPEYKGIVSEERFRAFLRRSGLQETLTASELRRLTEKLKRRGVGGARDQLMIDYERLCQQLMVVTETIPKSRAEIIFTKFQDAAAASAAVNRSFLSLCSLLDLRLTGKLSREEFLHVSKMMDCPITAYELEAMLELAPPQAVGRDNSVDYRIIQNMLQTFTPRDVGVRELDSRTGTLRMSGTGALPSYATPGTVTHLPGASDALFNKSIATPLGYTVSTPFREDLNASRWFGTTPMLGRTGGIGAYEKSLRAVIERIRIAIDERSRSWGAPFSLRRRFEALDISSVGLVSLRATQSLLEELGVIMTTSELHALQAIYGRPDDDRLFYDSFCRAVDSQLVLERSMSGALPTAGLLGYTQQQQEFAQPYINPRVLQRLQELRQEGRAPRDLFEAFDLDCTGQVLASKFREIITKLQLMQTEHQLQRAIEDFSAIGNRACVNYDDFCNLLDQASGSQPGGRDRTLRESGTLGQSRTNRRVGIADGDGYDGLHGTFGDRDDYGNSSAVYDSLSRFRQSHSRGYPVDLDAGSDSARDYALSPPKLSDSISGRLDSRSGRYGPFSPPRSSSRGAGVTSSWDYDGNSSRKIAAPKTPPSNVGRHMWGSNTPLSRKGRVPQVEENKWCCAVCMYVENPANADNCLVCDSPNYALNKDYQVKEVCRNCTFLNGQFAEECEMCGEPLTRSARPGTLSNRLERGGGGNGGGSGRSDHGRYLY